MQNAFQYYPKYAFDNPDTELIYFSLKRWGIVVAINHITRYMSNPAGKLGELYALLKEQGMDIPPTVLLMQFTRNGLGLQCPHPERQLGEAGCRMAHAGGRVAMYVDALCDIG